MFSKGRKIIFRCQLVFRYPQGSFGYVILPCHSGNKKKKTHCGACSLQFSNVFCGIWSLKKLPWEDACALKVEAFCSLPFYNQVMFIYFLKTSYSRDNLAFHKWSCQKQNNASLGKMHNCFVTVKGSDVHADEIDIALWAWDSWISQCLFQQM